MFAESAYAQTATPAAAPPGAPPAGGGGDLFGLLVPWIAILAIMYFLLIRPQQKAMKERQAMLAALKRGDRVLVNGIKGKIHRIESDEELQVEIAPETVITCLRSAVTSLEARTEPAKTDSGKPARGTKPDLTKS